MKTGIELFTEEREKQIYKHGFTGEHHFNHPEWYNERQIIQAATLLTLEDLRQNTWYPKNWDGKWFYELCNRPYSERLVISGALIASEINRLTYKQLQS